MSTFWATDPGRADRPWQAYVVGQVCPDDHGPDDLPGDGLEQVRPAACAVPDVVPHEVRDDDRVAGVVLRDVGLDLWAGTAPTGVLRSAKGWRVGVWGDGSLLIG